MLLIDVGNSRLKWAVNDGESYTRQGAEFYKQTDLNRCCEIQFSAIAKEESVYISCVAGAEVKNTIAAWFNANWGVMVNFVMTRDQCLGLKNGYSKMQSLGVDRWYAMLGAWVKYKTGFCLIDCGTAVTLDVVDSQGQHLGGLIMPGLELMRSSLANNTDAINTVEGKVVTLAGSTEDGVASGSYWLLAAGVESLFIQYQSEISTDLVCVVTGGNGKQIADGFKCQYCYEPDLVLDGMKAVVMSDFEL